MAVFLRILRVIFAVVGFIAAYGTLVADAKEVDVWGLDWQYWAMIGVTILWASLMSIIVQQHLRLGELRSGDKELVRREAKLMRIKALEDEDKER